MINGNSTYEESVIGALLTESPDTFPPNIKRLLQYAPDSFDDKRFGSLAKIIRDMAATGKPILKTTVLRHMNGGERLAEAGGKEFIDALCRETVNIDLAESDAKSVWENFKVKRTQSLLEESAKAVADHPKLAASIRATTAKELQELDNEDRGDRLTIRRPSEILAQTFDDSDIILGDRLLARGQSMALVGPGGVGKSRLLLQLAVANITGRDFGIFQTAGSELRWLIIQLENSNRRLQHDLGKLRDWVGAEDWARVDSQLIIHTLETDSDTVLALDSDVNKARIRALIKDTKPDVVAWDSLYNFAVGDLNKDSDMAATLQAVSQLSKDGDPQRAVIVLHHALTGKAGAAKASGWDRSSYGRNSKVLLAWTRGQINVAPGSPDSNEALVLTCGKCSNGREFSPFAMALDPRTMIYSPDATFDLNAWQQEVSGTKSKREFNLEDIKQLCRGGAAKAELAKRIVAEFGCSRSVAYDRIEKATAKRLITRSKANNEFLAN